jgi:hypothetical protein
LILGEMINEDPNLKNFKSQILESGISLEELFNISETELAQFFAEYLKLSSLSAKKAAMAMLKQVHKRPKKLKTSIN